VFAITDNGRKCLAIGYLGALGLALITMALMCAYGKWAILMAIPVFIWASYGAYRFTLYEQDADKDM
jgi:tryptophan-rich sensory protein